MNVVCDPVNVISISFTPSLKRLELASLFPVLVRHDEIIFIPLATGSWNGLAIEGSLLVHFIQKRKKERIAWLVIDHIFLNNKYLILKMFLSFPYTWFQIIKMEPKLKAVHLYPQAGTTPMCTHTTDSNYKHLGLLEKRVFEGSQSLLASHMGWGWTCWGVKASWEQLSTNNWRDLVDKYPSSIAPLLE